jgi:glycosyltransferase involved in cell wall biosynthesis
VRVLCRPRSVWQALRLAHYLRREGIDVLQVYHPDSTYFGVPAGRLAGVRHVIRTRNNLGHWMKPVDRVLGRLYARLATLTLANCEAGRQVVLAQEQTPPDAVVVLQNGVDLDRFLDVPALDGSRPCNRVGVVSNLRAVKGLDVLVRAAACLASDHPGLMFTVAGEGEMRGELVQRIHALGLASRFALPGSVSDIPGFLARVDIAVLCSRAEGMCNAVLEYMAAGRAIVATAVGANGELIADGVHGLLVPPDDREALAAAIARLVRYPALAAQLGAAARLRARQRYGREAMVRRFEDFYQDLVACSGS